MQLYVKLDEDRISNTSMGNVLSHVVEEFQKVLPEGPPLGMKPILIGKSSDNLPRVIVGPHIKDIYMISLATKNTYYMQAVYQFAHELCHVYCDPRVTNWFIESICEMTSYYMLHQVSERWKVNPIYECPLSYANGFFSYSEGMINNVYTKLNLNRVNANDAWIRSQTKSLSMPYERDINSMVAFELLEDFKNNKKLWQILPLLGRCTSPEITDELKFHENLQPDFNRLFDLVSPDMKDEVKALVSKVYSL